MMIGSAARASSRAPRPIRTTVAKSAHIDRNVLVICVHAFLATLSSSDVLDSGYATRECRHRLCSFQPYASGAHNRAPRNSNADLAIVAKRSWMKREHRVAIYVCRNCFSRPRLAFHQLLVIVEDRFYQFVDELVRQILVGDRK